MSHKTAEVVNRDWRFDLVTDATGVPWSYPYHVQAKLWTAYSDSVEVINTTSLEHEPGLKTAIINSLFLDRRAEPDDPVPAHVTDLRGWPGDGVFVDGDHIGSKLWMLRFIGKQTNDPTDKLLSYAKLWTEQALKWMVDDGICDYVKVTTWYPKAERLRIHVELYQNDNLIYRDQWEKFHDGIADTLA